MTCEIEGEGRLAASVGAVDVGAVHLGGAPEISAKCAEISPVVRRLAYSERLREARKAVRAWDAANYKGWQRFFLVPGGHIREPATA